MFRIIAAAALLGASPQSEPRRIVPFSSDLNDYNLSVDRAGRAAVFARSKAEFAEARIFVSTRQDGRWSEPAPIAFSDVRYSDTDPWLTPDGQWLYFISNRPVPGQPAKKDLDIWRSRRLADGWSAPEHLGEVNGPGTELGVELHGGTLYFSSVRKGGKGGLDIYSARQSGNGFEPPKAVEGPFNSSASDSDFTLSSDGRRALFWRSIAGAGKLHVARLGPDGWSDPEPLPDNINHGSFNFTPSFAADGKNFTYASTVVRTGQPEGMADIFIAKLPDETK